MEWETSSGRTCFSKNSKSLGVGAAWEELHSAVVASTSSLAVVRRMSGGVGIAGYYSSAVGGSTATAAGDWFVAGSGTGSSRVSEECLSRVWLVLGTGASLACGSVGASPWVLVCGGGAGDLGQWGDDG